MIDKPRGMGLTWLICTFFLWRWTFDANYSSFILSRTEKEVDDGTSEPDSSIFGKLRWQIDMLPDYLLSSDFKPKVGKGTPTDSMLRLYNPTLKSTIIGASTSSNAGRSRRYSSVFVDECFFIEKFKEVNRSLTSVARNKILVSTTVEDKTARDFKERCEKQGTYISLTYQDHPFKDEQWFNELQKKADDLDDPDIMREAKVNYSVSPKYQYYPQVAKSKVEDLEYNPARPLYISLDIGGNQDLTVIGYWQFNGINFDLLESFESKARPSKWYVPFFNPFAGEVIQMTTKDGVEYRADWLDTDPASPVKYSYSEYQYNFIQKISTWKKPIAWFGELDHTIPRMPTNQSTAQVLIPYGIRITYNNYGIEHEPRHSATSVLLPKIRFNDVPQTIKVYNAIANSKRPKMENHTSENLKPIHGSDGTADRRAMVENFCVNVSRILRKQREEIPQSERSFAGSIIKKLRN